MRIVTIGGSVGVGIEIDINIGVVTVLIAQREGGGRVVTTKLMM